MARYDKDFFASLAELHPSLLRKTLEQAALQPRLDVMDGLLQWLESLPQQQLEALGTEFWGNDHLLGDQAEVEAYARRARVKGLSLEKTYLSPALLFAAALWPRDGDDLMEIATDARTLDRQARSLLERTTHFMRRVDDMLSPGLLRRQACFENFVTLQLGHLRDVDALRWLVAEVGNQALQNIRVAPSASWSQPGKGFFGGVASFVAAQANGAAVAALMDADSAWGRRILYDWTERDDLEPVANCIRPSRVWARALMQESVEQRLGAQDSVLRAFESMGHSVHPELFVKQGCMLINALLEERLEHRKDGVNALPVIDVLWQMMPAGADHVITDKLSSNVHGPWLAQFCKNAAKACHAATLEQLRPAIEGPLKEAAGLWFGPQSAACLARDVVEGATARSDIGTQDFAACAQLLQDMGMDVLTDGFTGSSALHHMARSHFDVQGKMLVLVEMGADPHLKDAARFMPVSYMTQDAKDRWTDLVSAVESARCARTAVADLPLQGCGSHP